MKKQAGFTFFVFFLMLNLFLYGGETDSLGVSDISRVMDQMLKEHLGDKKISKDLLKESLQNYLEAFDQDKIYLLESEVRPFIHPSSMDLEIYLREYQNKDYSVFKKMDQLIKASILRAREMRSQEEEKFLTQFKSKVPWMLEIPGGYSSWAPTDETLRVRNYQALINFVMGEIRQWGSGKVQGKIDHLIAVYENSLKEREDPYLFVDIGGKPLSPHEKDHLFALHVLKALAKTLDSHTAFFDEEEAASIKMRLQKSYRGVGIDFVEALDGAAVKKLISNSPAEKNGNIQVGDILLAINDENVENLPLDEILTLIQSKDGRKVDLKFLRKDEKNPSNNQTYTVSLEPAEIELEGDRTETIYTPYKDGIVGKVTMHSFYQNKNGVSSEKDLKKSIDQLRQQGKLLGLILDLRDNGGGFLSQAIKVAGLFITDGVIVVAKYSDGETKYYRDLDGKTYYNGPLIILTSRLTASAAEIVTEALQDYGVAVIVGDDQTFGKGTIQSQTVTTEENPLPFKVTVGKYYTVSGNTPQLEGVKSDIVVPSLLENEPIGEKYLEQSITQDTIEPSYKDDLHDVDFISKGWYTKNYLPNLQKKETFWKKLIPKLKVASEKRESGPSQEISPIFSIDLITGKVKKIEPLQGSQIVETFKILKQMVDLKQALHQGD